MSTTKKTAKKRNNYFTTCMVENLALFNHQYLRYSLIAEVVIKNAITFDRYAGLTVFDGKKLVCGGKVSKKFDEKAIIRLSTALMFTIDLSKRLAESSTKSKLSASDEDEVIAIWEKVLPNGNLEDYTSFITEVFELSIFYVPLKEKKNNSDQQLAMVQLQSATLWILGRIAHKDIISEIHKN